MTASSVPSATREEGNNVSNLSKVKRISGDPRRPYGGLRIMRILTARVERTVVFWRTKYGCLRHCLQLVFLFIRVVTSVFL